LWLFLPVEMPTLFPTLVLDDGSVIEEPLTLRTAGSAVVDSRQASGRSLHGLEGDVVTLHSWTCAGNCAPGHEERDETPGQMSQCVENMETGSLERRIDWDINCLLAPTHTANCSANIPNFTEGATEGPRELMFTNCNQDEDVLHGECYFVCRFGTHLTKRCEYLFDRAHKYGLHGDAFHHCKVMAKCEETTALETQTMYCNETDKSLAPTSAPGSVRGGKGKGGEESGGMRFGIIAIVVGAGVVLMLLSVIFLMWRRMQAGSSKQANSANAAAAAAIAARLEGAGSAEDYGNGADDAQVVVGRPVQGGVAPPSGAAAGAVANNPKSGKQVTE